MRRSSTIIIAVLAVCATSTMIQPPLSPHRLEGFEKHRRANLDSTLHIRATPPPGTYEVSPGDFAPISGIDYVPPESIWTAWSQSSPFFPLAILATVSTGILVCFFLITVVKACAHRNRFADVLDYPDGMPEKAVIPGAEVKKPSARRDWEWDRKREDSQPSDERDIEVGDGSKGNRQYGSTASGIREAREEEEKEAAMNIGRNMGGSVGDEVMMPKVPALARSYHSSSSKRDSDGTRMAKSINSSANAIRNPGAHPLSSYTVRSRSDSGSAGSDYSRQSIVSFSGSYHDDDGISPLSPMQPPSPRSPSNGAQNSFSPRSILSNGGVSTFAQPRPLFDNLGPLSSHATLPLPSPVKLPSPGSPPLGFMAHLQNTQPLVISPSVDPTSPAAPGLRFAPLSLDAPPKKNKRFSAITSPLSNRFSFASSNWSFQTPDSPSPPPGPIERSLMEDQYPSAYPPSGGTSPTLTDFQPNSPTGLRYVERPRMDSIAGLSTAGSSGGRKSKRDIVSGVYSGYTPKSSARMSTRFAPI